MTDGELSRRIWGVEETPELYDVGQETNHVASSSRCPMSMFSKFFRSSRSSHSVTSLESLVESTQRSGRLFSPVRTVNELTSQVEVLRDTLMSAIQDIAVFKELLREKRVWDDSLYRKLRIQRMITDHSLRYRRRLGRRLVGPHWWLCGGSPADLVAPKAAAIPQAVFL